MQKIFSLLLITVFLFACSKDDDANKGDGNGGNIPADEKLLESVSFGGLSVFSIQYNDNKTVKRITAYDIYNNVNVFDFKYIAGNITSVYVTGNIEGSNGSAIFEFSYDANDKINGLTINDEERIIQYDVATNSYLYFEEGDEDRYTFFLNELGDLERFKTYDTINEEMNNYFLLYDDAADKNGGMVNTNKVHIYLAMISPGLLPYLSLIANKPPGTILLAGGAYSCTNNYYNDGFVKETELINPIAEENDNALPAIYKYTKL